jgi:D-glycero-D-manno-heptose 1,7-bisphosphate phosphatase
MKTVIMAGGKGTRISDFAKGLNEGKEIPKPLIPIRGIPVLERELVSLKEQGFDDIIITVGHLGQQIIDYFGDGSKTSPITGHPFDVKIQYYAEKEPLGNAGALFKIKNQLNDDFLLLNGDAVFDIDFHRFITYHKEKNAVATLFTHANNHPYDSGLLITNQDGQVVQWLTKEDSRPEWYKNQVNAGLHVVSPEIFAQPIHASKIDLDRQLLKPLAGTGKMYAYDSPEYVQDMGTPERYKEVSEACKKGIITRKNLKNWQRAVFLDRDGTINRYVGYLTDIRDFELLPGTAEAVRRINQSGYLSIVVTNQPVVARGEVTFEELNQIHQKMETLLGREGAYLDGIYVCPHHPSRGFPGEISNLKIECECRKPKPGLLYQAAEDFHIDLHHSWMIGDGWRDIEAGKNAGIRTACIERDGKFSEADMTVASLLDFTKKIFE